MNNQIHPRTKRWASIPPATFVYLDETLSEPLPGNDLIKFAQEMFLGNYLIGYVIAKERVTASLYTLFFHFRLQTSGLLDHIKD